MKRGVIEGGLDPCISKDEMGAEEEDLDAVERGETVFGGPEAVGGNADFV